MINFNTRNNKRHLPITGSPNRVGGLKSLPLAARSLIRQHIEERQPMRRSCNRPQPRLPNRSAFARNDSPRLPTAWPWTSVRSWTKIAEARNLRLRLASRPRYAADHVEDQN